MNAKPAKPAKRKLVKTILCALCGLCVLSVVIAADVNDWPYHDHDAGGQRFSPLKQITPANVATLEIAWVYHLKPEGYVAPTRAGRAGAAGRGGAPGRGEGPGGRGAPTGF